MTLRRKSPLSRCVHLHLPLTQTLAERIALYVQAFTLYSSVRPFGTSTIVGGVDAVRGPQLFVVEHSGMFWGYHGCAVGKGKQFDKTETEKLCLETMSMEEAVFEVARMYVYIANTSQYLQSS